MLLWRDYFHFLPVVGELSAAVQADDVRGRGVFPFTRQCPRLLGGYRERAVAGKISVEGGLNVPYRLLTSQLLQNQIGKTVPFWEW
jgi:hypothetical protein